MRSLLLNGDKTFAYRCVSVGGRGKKYMDTGTRELKGFPKQAFMAT